MTGAPPADRTVVHLLRHGEVHNPAGVLYGRLPGYHLSETGLKMADRAAEWFTGREVTHLVVSPMERARETAAPVAAALGLEPVTDDRIIEAGSHFEGHTFGVGDGSLRHPRHWRYLANPFRPSWGEPYRQVAARVLDAVRSAREAASGHEAVLVSHQMPIWIARRAAEGRHLWHDPRRRQCSLASITSFYYAGTALTRISYTEPSRDLLPGADPVAGA